MLSSVIAQIVAQASQRLCYVKLMPRTHWTRAMSGQAVPRVFVASYVHDLAKVVQKQMPNVSVDNLPCNRKGFEEDIQSGALAKRLQEVEVLLCDGLVLVTCLKAKAVPNLKWVQLTWAGLDNFFKVLDFKKPEQDFVLSRTGEGFGDLMGEYVVGHIIARERDFAGMRQKQEEKKFCTETFFRFRPLFTLSIGILGYGTIGKQVAEMCKAMGMTVWAVNRQQKKTTCPAVDYFRGMDCLGEVLQNCDYLCSILPNTPDTCDLLSGEVLKQCQEKKTVFINIGRGNVINDESLVRAVREGWIGGAILDVFNQEPLPADSELWSLPGVVITPHCSGPSRPDRVGQTFVKNLKLYLAGQPVEDVVDWERYY